jgi:hypothetical protein
MSVQSPRLLGVVIRECLAYVHRRSGLKTFGEEQEQAICITVNSKDNNRDFVEAVNTTTVIILVLVR